MLNISIIKKGIIHLRSSIRIVILISIACFIIIGILAFFYKPAYMVTYNGDFIGYSDSKSKLQEKIKTIDNISVETSVNVIRYISYNNKLVGLEVTKHADKYIIDIDGVFLAIGLVANNQPFKDVVNLNNYGYIDSINDSSGVYAAGDCLQDAVRQVVTAEASGVLAANKVIKFLEK